MRFVLALCALFIAVPASAATFQMFATVSTIEDFVRSYDQFGNPSGEPIFQELTEGPQLVTITLLDTRRYRCRISGFGCSEGFTEYSISNGIFSGKSGGLSSEYSLSFDENFSGTLSMNNEWTDAGNFRIVTFDLTPIPLPASGLLLLGSLLLVLRFRRKQAA